MQLFLRYELKKKLSFYFLNYIMAAKTSSPELSFGDWEGEDVDELLKQHKLDLIAVVRFLGVAFVHSDQHAREKYFFFNYLHFYTIF